MENELNHLSWIVPSITTLIGAIIGVVFSDRIKGISYSLKIGKQKFKNSDGNSVNYGIINNQYGIEESKTNSELMVKVHYRLFELTDEIIKLVTDAFRPVKFNPLKSNADYLNDVVDTFNNYVVYFDSKEMLFPIDMVEIVKEIRIILNACIVQQGSIEYFKNCEIPVSNYSNEITKMNEMYEEMIKIELPKFRQKLIDLLRKK